MLKILVILENSTNGFTQCTTSHPREGFYFFDDLVCYMYTTTATVMPHSCAKRQKPAKNQIEKFVKLTDRTCTCDDLTSFEYEVHGMTGNGSYLNMQNFA